MGITTGNDKRFVAFRVDELEPSDREPQTSIVTIALSMTGH
jgi:hypothetical protein